ncbi:MAG: hypothetical protein K6F93_05690, partial [Lachnospiraceae bacterium]|nr:hypothetical protein [Lachnospiraceae bacterium]
DVLKSENKADVLGDGTVSFDENNDVLTLNGATITKAYTKEAFAENPRLYFSGELTIYLRGKNKLVGGTTTVMGQALSDNTLFGDGKLTVTAEKNATLEITGMVSMTEYAQKSGTVTIVLSNNHSKITKWGMYLNKALHVEGGTLEVSSTGNNQGGAISVDKSKNEFNIAKGAKLSEGDKTPGSSVNSLTVKKGLTCNTKNYVKIVLPDIEHESAGEPDVTAVPSRPTIRLGENEDSESIKVTISKTENASGYYIYVKGPEDAKYKRVKKLKKDGSKIRSYTLKGLAPGTYAVKVKAYLNTDSKVYKSKYSKVKTISIG